MFTRKDYTIGKCSTAEYYRQLVNESNAKSVVLSKFTKEQLIEMYRRDSHLNWVPESLRVANSFGVRSNLLTWDTLAAYVSVNWAKYGDFDSLAGRVCLLKEAARMIVSE